MGDINYLLLKRNKGCEMTEIEQLTERINELERRISEIEQAPFRPNPPWAAPATPVPPVSDVQQQG